MTEPDALFIKGNIWSSEYAFFKEDIELAFVTRKFWNIPDVYKAAIQDDEDQHLILALIVVLDLIKDDRRRKKS